MIETMKIHCQFNPIEVQRVITYYREVLNTFKMMQITELS
jgi:hypothetical protein